MKLNINNLNGIEEINIGGVPLLKDIKKMTSTTKTNIDISDMGLDYNDTGESEVGEHFKKEILYANDKDSYQYALATAGDIQVDEDFEKIEKPKELTNWSVVEIQKVLNEFEPGLEVDGLYGIMTHTAIMNFGVDFLVEEMEVYYPRDKNNNVTTNTEEIPYIETAKDELGIQEWNAGDNPEVTKYHDSVNDLHWGDNVPWCASFITWVMVKNGYQKPRYSARAKSWLTFGKSAGNPVYGAIAVKSRKGGGHVCFVVGATKDGRYLYCLGGNQHDEVCISKYRRGVFLDFRVPHDYNYNIPLVDIAEAQNFGMAGKES